MHEQLPLIAFEFARDVPLEVIRDTFRVAALATESLLGRSAVRLDAECASEEEHTVVIDTSSRTGRAMARMFVGLIENSLGSASFTVRRDPARPHAEASAP